MATIRKIKIYHPHVGINNTSILFENTFKDAFYLPKKVHIIFRCFQDESPPSQLVLLLLFVFLHMPYDNPQNGIKGYGEKGSDKPE